MTSLDIPDVRILEDMVIECIYGGLLSGRLDNKNQQLTVDYVSSRDFKAEDAGKLFDKLKKWASHVDTIKEMLDDNLNNTAISLENNEKRKIDVKIKADEAYSKALLEVEAQESSRRFKEESIRFLRPGPGREGSDSD